MARFEDLAHAVEPTIPQHDGETSPFPSDLATRLRGTPDVACHARRMTNDYTPRTRAEHEVWGELRKAQDKVSDTITAFAGSMAFVYLHIAWFGVWLVVNSGLLGSELVFDDFPFGLLTLIVSLEAIFLSTFVMITQNRQGARADVRAQLDFETNLRSEVWSVHIGRQLGLDPVEVERHVQIIIENARSGLVAGTMTDVDPASG
jgi:uncharacterized membrane protein